MEPEIRTLVDISHSPAALKSQADIMLGRARWAGSIFQRFDRATTQRIVDAVAEAAHAHAGKYAEWAVEETGFGVVEHKRLKNELTATAFADHYRDADFINPVVDDARKMLRIPRPAGVVFALTPSTNPISTLNFKILIALMTRNAIVISPHPAARACCVDAARMLAEVAVQAGAPDGIIQIIEQPSIPLIEQFMASELTSVILATGGTAMVRSAYSSSNPAIGVGPGNAPVYVDPTARLPEAAKRIVSSKSFDNSILCTNESVLITLPEVEKKLTQSLKQAGAYLCDPEEVSALRRFLFHERGFNVAAVGRDATWIARECGIRVPANTKILLAPIEQIGVEERLSREKLCPVLAFHVAKNRSQALAQARAVLRLTGAGHSAAIHAEDPQVIVDYGRMVEAYRVVVNAPCSQGAAGFETHLAPTFTIGTGYFGRSSVGENIGPHHLVHWTSIAFNADGSVPFADFTTSDFGFDGPLPAAPADGVPGEGRSRLRAGPVSPSRQTARGGSSGLDSAMRDELRRLIAEELRNVIKGSN
ncbi:aldehyde dehydrogenase family protein [Aquibaculum sediminis]|uniref:aldehyde dehydrogenase family protein n=1 Tax=Aquibaculum sediminis TaxID=3231907 RepID=UPI00345644D4